MFSIEENSYWTPWSNWTICNENGTIDRNKTCIGTAKYGGDEGCEPEGKSGDDIRVCNISQGMINSLQKDLVTLIIILSDLKS